MTLTIRRSFLVVLVSVLVIAAGVFVSQRASAASATPVVYVATGENFPDALGAASAAAVQDGPVLLVQRDSIPAVTKAELTRLAPDKIVVAGGLAVVSAAVFDQLKAYAPSVVRAAGLNRYSTAVEVSKSAFPVIGGGGDLTALTAAVNALTARVSALEADNAALEGDVDALQTLLTGVTRDGSTLLFTGMNLQVVNGEDTTGTSNSVGNVIIGYNEPNPGAPRGSRVGSHYLIVGASHTYTHHSGIVIGFKSGSTNDGASVTGGWNNTASGNASSVSGGYNNTASGTNSSILGGSGNNVGANDTYPSCGCLP